jgi:phosphoesterase RecJ-like protein
MQLKQIGGINNGRLMELSPKQQSVNEIKNARHILILGHLNPDGDQVGSILALSEALKKIQKTVTTVITEDIPKIYNFLPHLKEVKKEYLYTDGKILRIDTKRIPIEGMKWRRDEQFLDIHLETEKNLKFEFIEIINGLPKPDLIIVVDTSRAMNIDKIYAQNEKIFLDTPVLNIDHHAGNEYFGTINLVDLTATSTAEILVSLLEALGIKIDTPDLATCLLTGILHDTQSFRSQNTTPKSMTVAAQLLAAGGRQQEIVKNLYNNEAESLILFWDKLVENLEKDETHRTLWSYTEEESIQTPELREAARELLLQNKGFELALIFAPTINQATTTVIASGTDQNKLKDLAKLFEGKAENDNAVFEIREPKPKTAEKIVLKKIAEHLSDPDGDKKQLWDVIEQSAEESTEPKQPIREHQPPVIEPPKSIKDKEDAIEEALKSISQAEKDENRKEMESLRDVLDRKRVKGPVSESQKSQKDDTDIYGDE